VVAFGSCAELLIFFPLWFVTLFALPMEQSRIHPYLIEMIIGGSPSMTKSGENAGFPVV
jgi:hypothetical protein